MANLIAALAQNMKDKKAVGDSFVLVLGAGASMGSGVESTRTIMRELVQKNGGGDPALSEEERFYQLWRGASDDHRALMIKPYLEKAPGSGYEKLADLIRLGFFDVVITFNFDCLLERALDAAPRVDYSRVIHGETTIDKIAGLVHAREPPVKILKMHGSLASTNALLFDEEEMLDYPEDLHKVFTELTRRDIVICGYGFQDPCAQAAVSRDVQGGAIYYVDPNGTGDNRLIRGLQRVRRSVDKVIQGEMGKFDPFMNALHQAVTTGSVTSARSAAPQLNPFKFLDYYREEQGDWLFGRRRAAQELVRRIERCEAPLHCVTGLPKTGKTSLILAGVIPRLDPNRYRCVHVRCGPNADVQLRGELERRSPRPLGELDWDAALSRVTGESTTRLVLFLDQFERPCLAEQPAPQGEPDSPLVDMLKAVGRNAGARLSAVFIGQRDYAVTRTIGIQAGLKTTLLELQPLTACTVSRIIRYAARRGNVTIDPKALETLIAEYPGRDHHPAGTADDLLLPGQAVRAVPWIHAVAARLPRGRAEAAEQPRRSADQPPTRAARPRPPLPESAVRPARQTREGDRLHQNVFPGDLGGRALPGASP